VVGEDDWELRIARAIFTVEKELGIVITADYPIVKFLHQLEMISWWREEEAKDQERARLGRY
jgi:hypothetical protein